MQNNESMTEFTLDEIAHSIISRGEISTYFYLRDERQRKLYLTEDIDQSLVDDLVSHIIQYNREDKGIDPEKRQPVMLYISSSGGEVGAGFELIDAIETSVTPVWTVCLGDVYSMAFIVALAGKRRLSMPNARFLMHDGSSYICDSGSKARDQVAFLKRIEDRTRDYIIAKTDITREEYDSNLRVEWYLFADEAKAKGMIDGIIGEDCQIDDIA